MLFTRAAPKAAEESAVLPPIDNTAVRMFLSKNTSVQVKRELDSRLGK